MDNQCSNEAGNTGFSRCSDWNFEFVGGVQSALLMQPEEEMFVRLCHKGVYPIRATVTGIERLVFLKDVNGKAIGTSNNELGYEVRKPKPNDQLTKAERKLLKQYNLLN